MQENLAQQRRGLHSRLAHAHRIRLVDFRLHQAGDESEEDFPKDGCPSLVVCGGELGAEERALQAGEGLMTDLAAGVEAWGAQGLEDGGPVGYPRCLG